MVRLFVPAGAGGQSQCGGCWGVLPPPVPVPRFCCAWRPWVGARGLPETDLPVGKTACRRGLRREALDSLGGPPAPLTDLPGLLPQDQLRLPLIGHGDHCYSPLRAEIVILLCGWALNRPDPGPWLNQITPVSVHMWHIWCLPMEQTSWHEPQERPAEDDGADLGRISGDRRDEKKTMRQLLGGVMALADCRGSLRVVSPGEWAV